MKDDLADTIDKCMRLLDENTEILSDIELGLDEDREDHVQSDMKLHHLYDMADDVAESSRLRAAEAKFMRRQTEG